MKFCGEDKTYTDTPFQFDPLGPAGTGGSKQRDNIFGTLDYLQPQFLSDAGGARYRMQQAANDTGWGDATAQARKTINGEYLDGGPQFNNALFDFQKAWGQAPTEFTKNVVGGQYLKPVDFGNSQTQATMNGQYVNQGLPAAQDNLSNRTVQGGTEAALGTMNRQAGGPSQFTKETLGGRYLNATPELNFNLDPAMAGIRQRNQAESANQQANIRSQFGKAGMGLSTGNQQAQQASNAAASARSNETEAQYRTAAQMEAERAKMQGYQQERGLQAAAGMQEDAARRNMAQFGAGQRIGATQFDATAGLNRDNRERGLQAQNYMTERGYQDKAGQTAQGLNAANYGQERALQTATGSQEQAAAREGVKYHTDAKLDNYTRERMNQQLGGQMLESAWAPQLNYMNQANNAYLGPLAQYAGMVQGLAGGGPIGTPNSAIVRQPGIYDYFLSTLGSIGSLAGGAAGAGGM